MKELRRTLVLALAAVLVVTVAAGVVGVVFRLQQKPAPILSYDVRRLVAAAPIPAPPLRARAASGVSADWLSATSMATGIPEPALRAYAVATLRVAREQPGCGLGWTTLAGIGEVESVHGTIGGRTLGADGRSDRPVLGPALDGAGDVAAIPATADSTQWHGDPSWDHAVGPLQFIPSSWRRWASDGDGDGDSDPNDIDDAAYAAARYLCADGHSLDGSGWGAAILSYNHSEIYVRSVYDAAAAYAARTS